MSTNRTALTDLGSAKYLGFAGGLYPDGKNSPPSPYQDAGIRSGSAVEPVDGGGKPSTAGKIVLLSIGMSNASQEFTEFIRLADAHAHKNRSLVLIDAARDGAAATDIALPVGDYWTHVEGQLQRSQISPAQVQVIWLKTALARERRSFPEHARLLQRALRSIVEILETRFPQLKLVYVSSRTYGGYAKSDLSPEPTAYESGFAVKWLIEERINNTNPSNRQPWLSWGPYLWADGMSPRSDGLIWERSDFEPDGVHTSAQGASKVAARLLEFFENNPTAKNWFLSRST